MMPLSSQCRPVSWARLCVFAWLCDHHSPQNEQRTIEDQCCLHHRHRCSVINRRSSAILRVLRVLVVGGREKKKPARCLAR